MDLPTPKPTKAAGGESQATQGRGSGAVATRASFFPASVKGRVGFMYGLLIGGNIAAW